MNVISVVRSATAGSWAQLGTVALGVWLGLSAFLWPHNELQTANTCVVGALVLVCGCACFARSNARYLTALVALWLYVSAGALGSKAVLTVVNNVVVAILLLALSLVREAAASRTPRHGRY